MNWTIAILSLMAGGYLVWGFYVPIFFDEVGWKIITSRYFLDGGYSINLFSFCGASSLLTPFPKILLPAAFLDAFLYQNLSELLKFRWLGLLNLVLFIFALFYLVKKVSEGQPSSNYKKLSVFCLGFLMAGTLPFGLHINRPEQGLVTLLALMMIIPLVKKDTNAFRGFLILSFCVIANLFFFSHAKALFFSPILFLVIWALRVNKWVRLALSGYVFCCSYASFKFYSNRSLCPESPKIAKFVAGHMLSPEEFFKDPVKGLEKIASNLFHFKTYIYNILFLKGENLWLPEPSMWPNEMKWINGSLKVILYGWLGLIAWDWIKNCRNIRNYYTQISYALIIGLLSLSGLMARKTTYESNLVLLCILLLGVLVMGQKRKKISRLEEKLRSGALSGLVIAALVSGLFNLMFFGSFFQTEWKKGGKVEGLSEGYSGFNLKPVQKRIEALARKCGIENSPSTKHLVIDALTYTSFWKTKEPFFMSVVDWDGLKRERKFLKDYQSDGLILQCRYLNEAFLKEVIREGDFCCMPGFGSVKQQGQPNL